MNKTIIASLIGLAFTTPTFSAEKINLNDVVVTATRVPQPKESVIADTTVINTDEIQQAGQTTLVELLQLQPGVKFSSNGGAGKVSSIFLRGSNSGHVVVLVDGMRINSATTGTVSFENLPLAQIDRIEILRGPATSLYGQDAIGGVIQLFTKKGEGKTKLYANIGYGTYDTSLGEAGVRGRINDTRYALNVSASNTNNFSALDSNNPNINDNDAYRNLAISGNLSQLLTEDHEIGIQFFNSDGVARFDNRFNATDFSSKTKLTQQSVALFSKNQWTPFWLSNFRIGVSKDKSRTYDEFGAPAVSRFDTEQTQVNWQNNFSLPIGTLTLMYDRLEEEITSSTQYKETNRINAGYVASYLANIGAHSFHLSYRDDHSNSFGNNQTGGIGYGFSFNDNWRGTASYGSAFKAPSFNDLYFPDSFGFTTSNPNLKPEKSDNIEASLRYQNDIANASLTIYENKIRHLIALNAAFVPFNANKATLKGLTLAGGLQMDRWGMNGSIDIQSPRDDETGNLLVRRSNRHAKLNLHYDLNKWRFGAEAIATSASYNDTANTKRIDGYTVLNLTSQYMINNDWTIQARINNVLDKNYTTAFSGDIAYNTPGSNLFVNLRYQPK